MLRYKSQCYEKNNIFDCLMLMLAVLFVSCSYIFARNSYGQYVLLMISILAYLVQACRFGGKIKIRIDIYCRMVFAFALFCLVSALWAIDGSLSATAGFTIIEILVCVFPFYIYFIETENSFGFFDALMWGGHLVALYTFVYFGTSDLLGMVITSTRMPDGFENSNSIGMICAYAIIISVFKVMSGKLRWHILLCIPSILVIAASGSRKALLLAILGVITGYCLKMMIDGRGLSILKLVAGLMVIGVVLYFFLSLPMFSMIMTRIEKMLLTLSGRGVVDNSTAVRQEMIKIGLDMFKTNPILGNGMHNSSRFQGAVIERYSYLHNNYVELLAGGGVVGTVIYYTLYIHPISTVIRRRKQKLQMDPYVLALLLMCLVMDYGTVTYYSKSTYIFLAAAFAYNFVIRKRCGV